MKLTFQKEVIDKETGEVIKAVAVIPEVRDKDFVKIYKFFSEKLLQDLGSINGEAKLLFWLIAKTVNLPIQSDLWVQVDYNAVAKELGTNERTVRRYFKKLLEKDYIEQFKARQTAFRIKPDLLYKGNLSKYKADQMDNLIREKIREEEEE